MIKAPGCDPTVLEIGGAKAEIEGPVVDIGVAKSEKGVVVTAASEVRLFGQMIKPDVPIVAANMSLQSGRNVTPVFGQKTPSPVQTANSVNVEDEGCVPVKATDSVAADVEIEVPVLDRGAAKSDNGMVVSAATVVCLFGQMINTEPPIVAANKSVQSGRNVIAFFGQKTPPPGETSSTSGPADAVNVENEGRDPVKETDAVAADAVIANSEVGIPTTDILKKAEHVGSGSVNHVGSAADDSEIIKTAK